MPGRNWSGRSWNGRSSTGHLIQPLQTCWRFLLLVGGVATLTDLLAFLSLSLLPFSFLISLCRRENKDSTILVSVPFISFLNERWTLKWTLRWTAKGLMMCSSLRVRVWENTIQLLVISQRKLTTEVLDPPSETTWWSPGLFLLPNKRQHQWQQNYIN